MGRFACLIGVALGACITDELVPCGDLACPIGRVCVAGGCATVEEAAACEAFVDGDACVTTDIAAGTCTGGACAEARCGNLIVDFAYGELCDDGDQVAGDGCSGDCLSTEVCGNGIPDFVNGEQCDQAIAGVSGDGCSSTCEVEFEQWTLQPSPSVSPRMTAMVYDEERQEIVLFGGATNAGNNDETWIWDGRIWIRKAPARSPSVRRDHAMAYDADRRRVVLFGGNTTSFAGAQALGDTWEWDGITWIHRNVPGPSPRSHAALTYDVARAEMILFGGIALGTRLQDTWVWNGTSWTMRSPATVPSARSEHAMAYDPQTQRVVLHGGLGTGTTRETWLWDGTTWTRSADGPAAWAHRMEIDPVNQGLVIVVRTGQATWRYSAGSWGLVSTVTAPSVGDIYALARDSRDRIILFGGFDGAFIGETWELGTNWTRLTPASRPNVNIEQAAAYDARRGRIVVFGGTGVGIESARTWEWYGFGWLEWFSSTQPPARRDAAMAYDERRGEMVLFGGAGPLALDDTWLLTGDDWMQRSPSASPPARAGHAMVYDRARDRVVLFGGQTSAISLADTWEWDGVTWLERTPPLSPSPRAQHVMAYDSTRERTVLFAGYVETSALVDNETWEWDGASWTHVMPATSPPPRTYAAATYDPLRRRVVVVAGNLLDDVWEWDGAVWSERLASFTPPTLFEHTAIFDAVRRQVVVMGVTPPLASSIDVWTRSFSIVSSPQERCTIASDDGDRDGLAGCADPDCYGRCAPLCPPGLACPTTAPRCGDGTCSQIEDYVLCPSDCAAPP